MRLSIVIPAFNEEGRIIRTLEKTVSYLEKQGYESEVIVVSDGSTDGTMRAVLKMIGDSSVRVRVFEYHPNRGKGYAVRFGMLQGTGSIIMFMDADYAVPISDLERGIRIIESGCDLAIGSRAVDGSRVTARQNIFRELSARFYTLVQNSYLGISYPDTQCGFKLFRRQAARELFGRQRLESVIFDPEILWLARKLGFRAAEFPVHWQHVANSRIQYDTIGKSIFVFRELFRIKRLHPAIGKR